MMAELVTIYQVTYGIIIHMLILIMLLSHSTLTADEDFSRLLLGLTIPPMIRILSLSLPLFYFNYLTWFAIISIPVYIAIFTCMYIQRLKPMDVGLSFPSFRDLPIEISVILIAIPIGLFEYTLLKPGPLIGVKESVETFIASSLIMIICTGFLEELAFRGLIQYHATKTMGLYGLFYVSAIFGVLHLGNLSTADAVLAFSVGLFYSLVVRKTGSIYGVSASHGLVNIVLFILSPIIYG